MKKIVSALIAAAMSFTSLTVLPPEADDQKYYAADAKAAYVDNLPEVMSDAAALPNPLISRDVPAYSGSSGSPSYANDDKYYTFWSSTPEDYIAYDLSSVPASQRKKVLAVWYTLSTYDNIGVYVSKSNEPVDYTIEVNKAPGGSYPSSGWEVAEKVSGNTFGSRQHVLDMEGFNWIRLNVTKSSGSGISINLDIHDVSQGVFDSWIFFGDSITAGGMVNAYGTSCSNYVNQIDSRYFPAQENGGIGGITSTDGRNNIDKWLSATPAHFVSIAYGTNDCWGNPDNTQKYYDNTKYMIDAILKAGKIPVLPKIPYSTNPDVGPNIGYYNAMIDKLYSEYGDKLVHGPDFNEFFKENTWGLSGDGVHPNSEGYEAMKKLWAETIYKNVYTNAQFAAEPVITSVKGDVNGDGEFNIADLVNMQKWLLGTPDSVLANGKAGELTGDGKLNVFDLIKMRRMLFTGSAAD